MNLRGTFAALGLLLAVGLMAAPVGAAKPCGRKSCERAIATQCTGLTGKAKGDCTRAVRAACKAGTCSCTGDIPCNPADASTVDTSKTQCCLASTNKCVVKTKIACESSGGTDMGPGTCDPDPCVGVTTPSTSTSTTTLPTTTTTTTAPPTTTTTSTTSSTTTSTSTTHPSTTTTTSTTTSTTRLTTTTTSTTT